MCLFSRFRNNIIRYSALVRVPGNRANMAFTPPCFPLRRLTAGSIRNQLRTRKHYTTGYVLKHFYFPLCYNSRGTDGLF